MFSFHMQNLDHMQTFEYASRDSPPPLPSSECIYAAAFFVLLKPATRQERNFFVVALPLSFLLISHNYDRLANMDNRDSTPLPRLEDGEVREVTQKPQRKVPLYKRDSD